MATAQDFAALRKQRSTIKASCTRINTYVDSITSVTPSVTAQLHERRSKLEHYWSEYNTVQSRLENLDDEDADDRAMFEEAFYALSAKIRETLLVHSPSSQDRVTPSTVSFTSASDSASHLDYTFKCVYQQRAEIPIFERFAHRRAGDVIGSLAISDVNYEVAWTLLKERYDNKRIIVQAHVKAIMELPSMTKENSCELRKIADGASKHIHALQALQRPTSHWDDLLIHILSSKLDPRTMREWQASLTGSDIPTFKQFIDFVFHQGQVLEATNKSSISTKGVSTRSQTDTKRQSACTATIKFKCSFCRGDHSVYNCKNFLDLPLSNRNAEIRSRKLCVNCLRSTEHMASKCTSSGCKLCKAKHNTLLHVTNSESRDREKGEREKSDSVQPSAAVVAHTTSSFGGNQVMLSTAVVYVQDNNGTCRSGRVLLDCGSQANFISKKFVEMLGLKSSPLSICISGINGATTTSTRVVRVFLQSRINAYSTEVDCIITDRVTDKLPAFTLERSDFKFPRNIKLADPQFHRSTEVDILIGAEWFWELLCVGQVKSSPKHPVLQKTRLGWVLAGRLNGFSPPARRVQSCHALIANAQLHDQVSHFWRQESISNGQTEYTIEETQCERHFLDNVTRSPQGRYIVKLPVKEPILAKLGVSRDTALKRFRNLERRFAREPILKSQYAQFLDEYLSLKHMKLVKVPPDEDSESYYLPHHGVVKKSEQAYKIRVVFDASCKSSSGISLNDALMVGPVIQPDLMSILLRFRTFFYVITADVIKMYRQILVHSSQTKFQRILWRNDVTREIETYELVTVTYGTASASFLATRCLSDLADRFESRYPVGSARIKRDFYVDDLLTGADTIDDARIVRDEVVQLLQLGLFELSKWASNCPELLEGIRDRNGSLVEITEDSNSRILGIQWEQSSDAFLFSHDLRETYDIVSKRTILSEVARLFDPLGLLGPILVTAKLLLQELWQAGIDWDESVPQSIHSHWLTFKSQLPDLNRLQISRCVRFCRDPCAVQIHGFCDASQRAYGACIYVRTKVGTDNYRIELCSKSRVAPLKAVSLPRLELSAALLLAQLLDKVRSSIDLSRMQIFLWSDSTITLNWITSPSRKWSVFVSNRVGEIQRLTELEDWRHVSSPNNPADILSRGLDPRDLFNALVWWHGPAFLQLQEARWPSKEFVRLGDNIPEERKVVVMTVIAESSVVDKLIERRSNLNKIFRIIAYCLRFRKFNRPSVPTEVVSHEEISRALTVACRSVQESVFPEECKALRRDGSVNKTSKLLSLSPFIDEAGLIRVGGRLKNSDLWFDACHPILLPRNHELTKRIIRREHELNMHAGAQATMASVRQRFWPLSLRSITRKIIRECVICFKAKPAQSSAIMGSLPADRVRASRPFSHCGVDYAGPVMLKEGKRRNARFHKAYISIFVCFATKAVHIELVSDLTSDAFLGALRRFISRRGKPSKIHSDNGTNFVGAHKQLKELHDLLNDEQVQSSVKEFLRDQNTSWCFIPPNAPHFGGLWEAAVKSAKYHMARIIGKAHLTIEEMSTVLCEIEAIMNSRPLTQLSFDPNDLTYLSPGHFLVGTAMNGFPCQDICDVNENRLTRWQRVEQLRQHFWRRWSSEYLHSLQERKNGSPAKGRS